MEKAEAPVLVKNLESFLGTEPCDNPVALEELRRVRFATDQASLGGYVEEKMLQLYGDLELWFGGGSWGRAGRDVARLKGSIVADFVRLRDAIGTRFSH